ncbi:MAG: hypothetical protein U1C74_02130 [Phenylobacterium sp.]|nr:hypothetical protein [Phenylobacterium sp.]
MKGFAEEFANTVAADRRLAILRMLADPNIGPELGESTIEKGLRMWGFRTKLTREVVQADLLHLGQIHCVHNEIGQGGYIVATITRIGVQAAQGAIMVEGVSRPQIGL